MQKKEVTMSNPYTDWQIVFDNYFTNKKDLTILELGVGKGTYYLLDNFKKVISLEYSRYEYEFKKIDHENHTYIELENDEEIIKKDNVLIETIGGTRPDVKDKVNLIIDTLKKYKADIIFVDFGFHFRGEVVQELINLNKYKYITYHDTNFKYYGYENLDLKNYKEVIRDERGQGTVIISREG
jgi:hypothetical protein